MNIEKKTVSITGDDRALVRRSSVRHSDGGRQGYMRNWRWVRWTVSRHPATAPATANRRALAAIHS
jgi:hypothetical protein